MQSVNSSENVTERPMQATVFSLQNAFNNVLFQSRFLSGVKGGGVSERTWYLFCRNKHLLNHVKYFLSFLSLSLTYTHRERREHWKVFAFYFVETRRSLFTSRILSLALSLTWRVGGGWTQLKTRHIPECQMKWWSLSFLKLRTFVVIWVLISANKPEIGSFTSRLFLPIKVLEAGL